MSGYKVNINGVMTDITQLFHPLESETPALKTDYTININGSLVDLNQMFEPIENGEAIEVNTNFKVAGRDLREVFAGKDTVSNVLPDVPLENEFKFEADWLLVTYTFTDGRDLDTNTSFIQPIRSRGMGWCRDSRVSNFAQWGGDNTGTGREAVLINVGILRQSYQSNPLLGLELRAWWYGSRGARPVYCSCEFWKGGTPTQSGYTWVNNTASDRLTAQSISVTVGTLGSRCLTGDLVSYLYYDLNSYKGGFSLTPG